MRGVILAAGRGTRLAPLTDPWPKPLAPLAGVPALARVMTRLRDSGITEIGVNAFHRAECMQAYLGQEEGKDRSPPVQLRIEPEIQGTLGGVVGFRPWLGDHSALVHNGDIATDLPLGDLMGAHRAAVARARTGGRSLALTMALIQNPSTDSVCVDGDGWVRRFERGAPRSATFSGISIMTPALLERHEPNRPADFVPSIEAAMDDGLLVAAWLAPETTQWTDFGTPWRYWDLHRRIARNEATAIATAPPSGWQVSADAQREPRVILEGWGWLGAGAKVGAGARLRDTIVWPHTRVEPGEDLEAAILTPWARVEINPHDAS